MLWVLRKSCFWIISRICFHKHWAVNYTLWSRGDFPDGQMALWAGFHATTSLWRLFGTNRFRLAAKNRVAFKMFLAISNLKAISYLKGQVKIIIAQLSNFETFPFCFAGYQKFIYSNSFFARYEKFVYSKSSLFYILVCRKEDRNCNIFGKAF